MGISVLPSDSVPHLKKYNRLLRYPLVTYFLLAYLISWGLSLNATRGLLPFVVPPLLGMLAVFLYHFGPSLAGIILTAIGAGRAGVRILLRPLGRLRVGIGWYLFIILYPFALRLAAGLNAILGGPTSSFFSSQGLGIPAGNLLVTAPLVFPGTLIFAGVAEEISWRGFALPRLQFRFGALSASLILAAIWALWHYNPLNLSSFGSVLPLHALSVIGFTILLTWVYNSTGSSLGMTVLFHGISNFADWVVHVSLVYAGDLQSYFVYALLNLAAALIIVLVFGRENLSMSPRVSSVQAGN
jgi:membrane protease YdiL (CAAX protease family)